VARVEGGRRLVEQDDARAAEQADRDVDAVGLTEREPLDRQVELIAERDRGRQLGELGLGLRHAREPREERQILACAEAAVERGALAAPRDLALVRTLHAPSLASAEPASRESSVVLPAPFGPSSARRSPACSARSMGRALPFAEALDQPRTGDQRGTRAHADAGGSGSMRTGTVISSPAPA